MGPTAVVPYSQYWTVDHDERAENICIEMLHPISMSGRQPLPARDAALQEAVSALKWPLVRQVQLCVGAGDIILMTQNCFHRRNRRRDSVAHAEPGPHYRPRFMWRFMCYRTTEPIQSNALGARAASELVDTYASKDADAQTGASFSTSQIAEALPVWLSLIHI